MQRRWKGLISLLMAGTLLLGATGCTQQQENVSKNEENNKAETQTEVSDSVTLKVMGNYSQANFQPSDNAMIEEVEKNTGTKLEFEVPPSSGYKERLQLMLVSGEYPDLIMFPGTDDESFLNAVNDGVVIPVNQYIDNAPNVKEYTYDISWDALRVKNDENIYGIPRTSITRADGFWVRKDWLENVGLSIPENNEVTIEEFNEILRRFTFNDPDKNGLDDTYGFAAFTDANKILQPVLSSQFGNYGWQVSDGKYDYMTPEFDQAGDIYKTILDYTGTLYKEGVLDPDAPVNNGTTARERFWRGITGVAVGFGGHYKWYMDEMSKINPDADITYAFVKNQENEVKGIGYGTGVWGLWAISQTCENPQKAVEVLDYLLSDEGWEKVYNGFEGIDYTVENGEKVYIPDQPQAVMRRNTVRRAGDAEFFIGPDVSQEIRELQLPLIQKAVDTVVRSKDRGFTPEAAKRPDFMDYKKVMDETKTKIMLGETDASSYDEALAGWYKNGGEEYVGQMNEYINQMEK